MEGAIQVDSRQYVIAFFLDSPENYPEDFQVSEAHDGFQSGLFLPRDQADWLGRSSYPPYILTLVRDALLIHTHPSAKRPPARIPLVELLFVESGHILLLGWVRLVAAGCECTLRYNTVYARVVQQFLNQIRDSFAAVQVVWQNDEHQSLKQEVDLKLKYAVQFELAPGELISSWLYRPARAGIRRFWFFSRRNWSPANLLVLTPRRLIWITDRHEGRHERYGIVMRYIPLRKIAASDCCAGEQTCTLEITFGSREPWRILWPVEYRNQVQSFSNAITKIREFPLARPDRPP